MTFQRPHRGAAKGLQRRHCLTALATLGLGAGVGRVLSAPADAASVTSIAATWRGPQPDDPHLAGVLVADWDRRTLQIRSAVPLPTRAHGLLPGADGSLLVNGVRPGAWLLRCSADGRVLQRADLRDEPGSVRLSGHVVAGGDHLYTTEIDYASGQGRIGVRDPRSLRKVDEWSSGGIEPHQLLLDEQGHLMVANGGVPRSLSDRKLDLHQMDSSLVRLDGNSGRLLQRWTLDDRRLSLRHLAYSRSSRNGTLRLGVAMQAEHDDAAQRAAAPILAVLEGDRLTTPAAGPEGKGYAGDISAAMDGGFALSSNQAGVAQVWQPAAPATLSPFARLKEAYALAAWSGPQPGGVLVATAPGLLRWHPAAEPVLLRWPEPMALDNHWVVMG